MPIEMDIYQPRTMIEAVKRTAPNPSFFRDTFFKKEKFFETEEVDVDFKKGTLICAPYVSRKIGGKIIPNTGYETKTYTPPLLAPEKITTVDDILKRSPGETLYNGKSPAERAVEKMIDDFQELENIITRREEEMCAEIMTTGKLNIKGDGFSEEIDFGLTNTETLSSTKKWSASAADPMDDIDRWTEKVREESFTNPDIVIMSSNAARAFIRNETVKSLLDVKNYNLGAIAPTMLPGGVSYVGYIGAKNLSIFTYDGRYIDDWTDPEHPVIKPFVPSGKVVVASSAAEYVMAYGGIGVVDDEKKLIGYAEGKRIPDTYVMRKPVRRFLNLSSAPMPVPVEANSWFVAQVL